MNEHLNYKVIHTFYYNKTLQGVFGSKYKPQEINPRIPIQSTSQNCPKMHRFYFVLSIRPFSLQFFLAIATLKLAHELKFCTVLAMGIYCTITQCLFASMLADFVPDFIMTALINSVIGLAHFGSTSPFIPRVLSTFYIFSKGWGSLW